MTNPYTPGPGDGTTPHDYTPVCPTCGVNAEKLLNRIAVLEREIAMMKRERETEAALLRTGTNPPREP